MRKFAMLLAAMLAPGMIVGGALAADAVKKDQSILDRLYANTGVYNKSAAGKTPALSLIPVFLRPCRIAGCWARSRAFTSISTITSG